MISRDFCEKAPFAGLKLGWNWLKNTVPAELLWEKNTIPAEKKAEQAIFKTSERGLNGLI